MKTTSTHSAGKGDTPRPISVDRETFSNNWDQTFGNTDSTKDSSQNSE